MAAYTMTPPPGRSAGAISRARGATTWAIGRARGRPPYLADAVLQDREHALDSDAEADARHLLALAVEHAHEVVVPSAARDRAYVSA